jgi:RimJ/RimL family protein N-acetyltransferase
MLQGKKVRLREVRREDLPLLREWRNRRDIQKVCRQHRPISELSQEGWFERISDGDCPHLMFVVEAIAGEGVPVAKDLSHVVPVPIGVVGLCYWDKHYRSAEISFYIGAERFKRRGLCSDALRTLIAYGFEDLHLHKIWAEVFEFNEMSSDLLYKLGMKKDGFHRDTIFRFGEWHGSHILSILEDEWRAIGLPSKASLLNGMESEFRSQELPATS